MGKTDKALAKLEAEARSENFDDLYELRDILEEAGCPALAIHLDLALNELTTRRSVEEGLTSTIRRYRKQVAKRINRVTNSTSRGG